MTGTQKEEPLFARLLGSQFAALPPTVQRIHLRHGGATYAGEVTVERGTALLARVCIWAARLPPAMRGPIGVDIDAGAACERWTRRVGRHAMRSRLWVANGLLCERLGLVTFGFELSVEDNQLIWRVARVRALGIPLPAAAFEQVLARESEVDGRYTFDVTAALPLAGPLVHYRGGSMSQSDGTAVIVFDGVCVLCNGWVRFLIRHDRCNRYRFAAMRTPAGRTLLEGHGLDPDDPVSFLLVDEHGAWTDTTAIARVLAGLGGRWRLASRAVGLVPHRLRDAAYRRVARNRYRWFGRRDQCRLPTLEERERFLS